MNIILSGLTLVLSLLVYEQFLELQSQRRSSKKLLLYSNDPGMKNDPSPEMVIKKFFRKRTTRTVSQNLVF